MDAAVKLRKIDRLQKKLAATYPSAGWNQDFIEKVKVDFTYNSNRIEGNAISYGQTIQLLKDFVTPKNATTGDCLDILNHQQVLDDVFAQYNATEITEANIKRLHKSLMKNSDQWSDSIHYDPGKYKILDNVTVRSSGKLHNYKEPSQVGAAMEDLIQKTNLRMDLLSKPNCPDHPLAIATDFHFDFLNNIHPFGDGNGRIARIVMNIILLKWQFPPVFITAVNKADYMNCFEEEERTTGSMLDFMCDRLIESLKSKEKFLKQNSELRE